MNKQQAENLRILIRHMETKCDRTLDMGRYFTTCGTPACAAGEACTIPALQLAGLVSSGGFSWTSVIGQQAVFGDEAVMDRKLFYALGGNPWKRDDVTPQEWAAEARKVLAENGYSMDEAPAPEPFKRFMERVMEPVTA